MNEQRIDITDRKPGTTDWIVIPVNLCRKGNGEAVMGAGLALWAKQRYPELPMVYGNQLYAHGIGATIPRERFNPMLLGVVPKRRVILFPTKRDWSQGADLDLIRAGAHYLVQAGVSLQATQPGRVLIPRLGCGLGGLDWHKDVKPVLDGVGLDAAPFVYCTPPAGK